MRPPGQLIEGFLPRYQFREYHHIRVHGSPRAIDRAIRTCDMGRSPVIRWLYRLRGLPDTGLTLVDMTRAGFVVLADHPGVEVVMGLAGQFWRLREQLVNIDAERFASFDAPDYAKAAWNFLITPTAQGTCRLSTETRVYCTTPDSRRRFMRYWLVIRPFSGWIRREILAMIKREVESNAQRSRP